MSTLMGTVIPSYVRHPQKRNGADRFRSVPTPAKGALRPTELPGRSGIIVSRGAMESMGKWH